MFSLADLRNDHIPIPQAAATTTVKRNIATAPVSSEITRGVLSSCTTEQISRNVQTELVRPQPATNAVVPPTNSPSTEGETSIAVRRRRNILGEAPRTRISASARRSSE